MADPARPASAVASLAAGVEALARVMARTYGPVAGPVLLARAGSLPEVLDDSGVLARRMTGVGSRRQNAGAMALRSMCLETRRQYGDGAATAAVLARALVARASRLVAAGADPVLVRRGIERGVSTACDALEAAATPAADVDDLSRLAVGACHDPEAGGVLAELFDVLGERAGLVLEEREVPGVERGYVDGARWRARPAFTGVLADGASELALPDPVVVVAGTTLKAAADVVPALEHALAARRPLVLVARGLEGAALSIVQRNRARLVVVPVCLTSGESQIPADLDDLALLAGATVLDDVVGAPPRALTPERCGRARHVVLTKRHLTLTGGVGDSASAETRVAELAARSALVERGSDQWRKLRLRIARLSGAQGVIVIGGYTESDRQRRADQVAKAQRVLELAHSTGVVPGGGVAYLACVDSVLAERLRGGSDDESWGLETVAAALDAPFRQLVGNYRTRHDGPHPALALEHVRELGAGWGFDARQGDYVQLTKAGVLDAAGVLAGALRAAGSLAASMVSVAVVVRARKPAAA